jgi:hypothetical protein
MKKLTLPTFDFAQLALRNLAALSQANHKDRTQKETNSQQTHDSAFFVFFFVFCFLFFFSTQRPFFYNWYCLSFRFLAVRPLIPWIALSDLLSVFCLSNFFRKKVKEEWSGVIFSDLR